MRDGIIDPNNSNIATAGDNLMNLLAILGKAYSQQSRYHCKEAEQIYRTELTNKQKETGWVQGQLAKCVYE